MYSGLQLYGRTIQKIYEARTAFLAFACAAVFRAQVSYVGLRRGPRGAGAARRPATGA